MRGAVAGSGPRVVAARAGGKSLIFLTFFVFLPTVAAAPRDGALTRFGEV